MRLLWGVRASGVKRVEIRRAFVLVRRAILGLLWGEAGAEVVGVVGLVRLLRGLLVRWLRWRLYWAWRG